MKTLYALLLVALVLGAGLIGCSSEQRTTQDQTTVQNAPNGTNGTNDSAPLGTGYAGRGNIREEP